MTFEKIYDIINKKIKHRVHSLKGGKQEMTSCKYKTIQNSRVRFKNNKPYLAKKIVVTALFFALISYFVINMHWITNLILLLFLGLPLAVKVAKQPAEGKGFFGKIANFYKNMYKNYLIDVLPIEYEVTEEKFTIKLHNAETMKFKTVDETYEIAKNDVAGILFDDASNDILVMFQKADIAVTNTKTGAKVRNTKQHDATVCFGIEDNLSIVEDFKKFGYPIETLSEIEDAEPEERDPELLVNKMLATIEDEKKASDELLSKKPTKEENEDKQED